MYATITKTGRIWDSRRILRQAGCLRTIPPWEAQYDVSHDSAACIIATHWQRRLAALHFGTSSLVSRLGAPSFFLGGIRINSICRVAQEHVKSSRTQGARVNSLFCARKVLMNYRLLCERRAERATRGRSAGGERGSECGERCAGVREGFVTLHYRGSPTFRINSANRGSERSGSTRKSVFKPIKLKSRS